MAVEALVPPDAARVTIRIATHAILASQQCTQMPQNGDERPFPPICVHFFVPTATRATGASGGSRNSVHCHSAVNVRGWNVQARVAVRSVRPGPSGSVTHTRLHTQARVAVQLTLPLGGERVVVERSGPSGSATHTRPHAQGPVAVQVRATSGPAGAAPSAGMRPKRSHPEPTWQIGRASCRERV